MTKGLLPLVAILLAVTAGCKTMTGETAGQNLDDSSITASVKSHLATEERMGTLTQINVKTVANTVYLSGIVSSPLEKTKAEEIARQVNGVKQVVNNIEVKS